MQEHAEFFFFDFLDVLHLYEIYFHFFFFKKRKKLHSFYFDKLNLLVQIFWLECMRTKNCNKVFIPIKMLMISNPVSLQQKIVSSFTKYIYDSVYILCISIL